MADLLNTFSFEGSAVRTVVVDGEPWFVAADVATLVRTQCQNTAWIEVETDTIQIASKISFSMPLT
jgi:prophage antirepressor-like protein